MALVDEGTKKPQAGRVLPSFAMHKAQEIYAQGRFIRGSPPVETCSPSRAGPRFGVFRGDATCLSGDMRHAGFPDFQAATLQRVADIESLGRTRELVAKDLVLGGKYEVRKPEKGGGGTGGVGDYASLEIRLSSS